MHKKCHIKCKNVSFFFPLDDIPQFVFVTAIDDILPPKRKLENVYTCQRVEEVCLDVSHFLDITLSVIFPVSNYYEQLEPSVVENAMSLTALWNVVTSGQRYIMHKRRIKEN